MCLHQLRGSASGVPTGVHALSVISIVEHITKFSNIDYGRTSQCSHIDTPYYRL